MTDCWKEVSPDLSQQWQCGTNNILVHDRNQYHIRYTAYHSINQTIESPYYKCDVISPDTTTDISVGCYLWGLLTAFHQTSWQLVTSQSRLGLTTSRSRLGHSSQRLGLAHLRLGSHLGLGWKGLVHIPACQHPSAQFFTGRMPFLLPNQQCQSTEGSDLWLSLLGISIHTLLGVAACPRLVCSNAMPW